MRFLLMCSLLCLPAFAQQVNPSQANQALEALGTSDWGRQYNTTPSGPDTTPVTSREVEITDRVRADQSCTADQQTSLPYKFFLNLLSKKELNIDSNPSSESVTFNTGTMIGNCNDMLNFNFALPQDGRPYLFQVEIRKPADCMGDVCEYEVQQADGGVATGTKTISVAPNYYGFVQCLQESGVMGEGGIDPSKIAPVEVSRTYTGMNSTEPIWFYSHGPEAAKQGGVFSGNKKNENSCRYYEDIAENGYTYFSQEDINKNRKMELYSEICNSGDYRLIERHLPEFSEFSFMKNILENVRNIYLLEEVKKLRKEVKKRKDFSKLDADKYQKILNDFYNKIIVPKRRKLENLVAEHDGAPEGRVRKSIRDDIKELVAELEKLIKDPYLTKGDYANMKSFIKKAPLHEEAWRDAALKLFASNNTVYHYKEATKKLNETDTSLANQLITADVQNEREILDNLGRLAEDTDTSVAGEYRAKARSLETARDELRQSAAMFEKEEMDYLYNHCYNPNKYWVNRQKCAQEVAENIRINREADQQIYKAMHEEYNEFAQQADYWSGIEQQRDAAYGVSRDGRTTASRQSSHNNQNVDQRAFRTPNYQQNYQDFYQRMMSMNVPQRGFNAQGYQGFDPRFSFEGGAGNWRQPAGSGYWGMQQPSWSNQGMQPNYNYFMNSSTMYGPMQFR